MAPVAEDCGVLPRDPDTGVLNNELVQGEDRKEPFEQFLPVEPAEAAHLHEVRRKQGFECPPVLPEPRIRTGMLPQDKNLFQLFRIL